MLGLPDTVKACLFDLDGVLTDTAAVHRAAWAATFDPVLRAHGQRPFSEANYEDFVDGKPRFDGVRDFLAARGISVPEGSPDDPPDAETVYAIGQRKNLDVVQRIRSAGVRVFPDRCVICRQPSMRNCAESSSPPVPIPATCSP